MVRLAHWSRRLALAGATVVLALAVHATSAPSRPAQSPTAKDLTVSIVNDGDPAQTTPWGQVTSDPAGIACPPTCSAPFEPGATVKLAAQAAPGYLLEGWNALPNADACTQPPTCTITVDSSDLSPSVDASFLPAADLQLVTAGPGTLTISPPQAGKDDFCVIDAQLPIEGTCEHRFPTGTRVTVTANPSAGARFAGWSDYQCPRTSRSCTLVLPEGTRFLTARFSPVKLTVQPGAYGAVTVTPGGTCTFAEGAPPCEFTYASGTVVTLRRQHAAPGNYWIGACNGNTRGGLDANVCKLRLQGNELIAAGRESIEVIPPPRGSGIEIGRTGKGKGKVTGRVVNDSRTLTCGGACTISGLTRYDQVRLTAKASKGSKFAKWSDGSKVATRIVELSGTTRISASFGKSTKKKSKRR